MSTSLPEIAVVGCGAWGMNHLRVWSQLGCLKTACDSDPHRLEAVQESFPQIETCSSIDALLDRPEIRALVIATPAPTHAGFALRALEAGKDVLVEKPLALTLAEGELLAAMSARLRRILMVGHVLEYHPAIRKLQELIAAGALGRLQYISSSRLNLGRIRSEENALWSFAPHDIAILLRLLGASPQQVACHGGAYLNHHIADVTLTSLCFAGGTRAHIFVSWLHPFKEQSFVIVGDRQMAVFDDTRPWPQKLVLYPHQVDWIDGKLPVARKAEAVPVALEQIEPLQAECEHFLDCLMSRRRPLTDAQSGLTVLRTLDAAQRSLEQSGQPVRLEEVSARPEPFSAHPTAVIDPGAEIGEGTRVWHYSHIMSGARIGRNCVLGQNVFVGRHVRVGDGVKIQNNVSLYEGVALEDDVFCGPSMVFTNVLNPRSAIERKNEFRPTLVRKGATIGANATIVCGVTIGRFAFVGAGAVVNRDVPDYALVVGVPAEKKGWMSRHGHRLKGPETDGIMICPESGWRYREIAPGLLRCLDCPEDSHLVHGL